MTKEKLAWQKNEEELMKGKIETEIALAKMDWAKVCIKCFYAAHAFHRFLKRICPEINRPKNKVTPVLRLVRLVHF